MGWQDCTLHLMEQIEVEQARAVTSPDELEEEEGSYAPGDSHIPPFLEVNQWLHESRT